MSPFNFYAVFYLNLMFSSFSVEDRITIIERCYWPLLDLVERGMPLGIQISGVTLEIIKNLDPAWIKRLKKYLSEKKCELVGSGYAQIIAPLVPAEVNYHNQILGLRTYRNILDVKPKIATVAEMAYSPGLLEHYIDNGYQAILMEWNNPRRYHPEWNDRWRYYRQNAAGLDNRCIFLLWVDTIAFQKFQRYVHGELDLEEYTQYLFNHGPKEPNGYLCLYASDTEVINFRTSRYHTELEIKENREWDRINVLFDNIMREKNYNLLLPSRILGLAPSKSSNKRLCLESAQNPIPVKKQEKYNITRWALSGRDDVGINTKCYKIYKHFKKINNNEPEDWKKLCYLWSSDFRTHITVKRWGDYLERLNRLYERCEFKGNAPLKKKKEKRIRAPYCDKHLRIIEDERYLTVETDSMKCRLNKFKGLTIDKFWFKNISKEPLFGTLPHGYYDDISFGADFYSGHAIIEVPGEHKITDLEVCKPEILLDDESLLIVRAEISNRNISFKKEYHFNFHEPCFETSHEIRIGRRQCSRIHPVNITFIPTSFDKNFLFYATHNGGREMARFKLGDNIVHHAQSLSPLISATRGLGATEGIVVIGDEGKHVSILHDSAKSALIPFIHYVPMYNNQYFLRLQYSAQEIDETFVGNSEGTKLECCWRIASAATADVRTASTHLSSRIGGSISQMVGKGTRISY